MTKQQWALLAGLSVVLVLLIYLLAPILAPFLVALGLAYLGNPLVARLQDWRWPRTLAVIVVFALFFLVAIIALLVLLPALQRQIMHFATKLPAYIDWVQMTLIPVLQQSWGIELQGLDIDSAKQVLVSHWQDIGTWLGTALRGLSSSGLNLLGWLINLSLVPLVSFYFLRDWDTMWVRLRALLPPNMRQPVTRFATQADGVLGAFLRGQLLVMLLLAIIYFLGLSLIGLDLALPLALLAGAVSFVPYLGVIVGLLSAGLAALLQFQEPTALLWVVLVFGIGQFLEGFILTPYIVGDRLGLHPLAVIFAIMAGGQLFGFVGVLLALPVAAVLLVALRDIHDAYMPISAPTSTPGRRRPKRKKPSPQ